MQLQNLKKLKKQAKFAAQLFHTPKMQQRNILMQQMQGASDRYCVSIFEKYLTDTIHRLAEMKRYCIATVNYIF